MVKALLNVFLHFAFTIIVLNALLYIRMLYKCTTAAFFMRNDFKCVYMRFT